MKKSSLISKIIVTFFIILFIIFIKGGEVEAYTNHTLLEAVYWLQSKVGTYVDYDTWMGEEYKNQCTDLIYAYYDYLVGYVEWGNADAFIDNNLPAGWCRTQTPTQGDIVVWAGGTRRGWPNLESASAPVGLGHVGIVWTVNSDGSIDTIENNGDWRDLQGPCRAYTRNPSEVACYIHPDFYDQTSTKPSIPSNILNLGNDFYSYMIMSNELTLFNVDVNSQVILQKGVWQDTKQIWHFVRQSDGSYTIKNVVTGKYLDVLNRNDYDGGVIQTLGYYNGSPAQRFYLYGEQDKCVIRPACSTTRVVSVDGGKNLVGKKLNMWEYWGVETQLFNIWKVNEAKASTLSYSEKSKNVTLNWTKGDGVDKYNIIIKSGTSGNVKEYKKIVDIAETSYNISLPVGYYEITVEGWNYFSNAFSNVVKFTITDDTKFADVKKSDWFYSAVEWCNEKGIMKGYTNGKFGPNDKATRGMVVTILHTMAGQPYIAGKSIFSDVTDTQAYYYSAVKWAASQKIASGYGNGKFGPNDLITREQLVVMLNNYCVYRNKYKKLNGNMSQFKDVEKISPYAKYALNWAVGSGVITGSNGNINPQENATRAETASMIYKYCVNIGK